MDLRTRYLGFDLPHPIMAGASPLADDLDGIRRLEDAGAAAIVFRSLFEEQITREQLAEAAHIDTYGESFAEAATYFPAADAFALGSYQYLENIRRAKAAVSVPVIASLNGTTPGGWIDYARLMADAGADALELNLYHLATDPATSGAEIERQLIETVAAVRQSVIIPIAVKLSPFFTALAHFARQLEVAGADGLVLFNRFYQPDIDPEALATTRTLYPSDSSELLLRLHWMAILSGRVGVSLAVSGGVHGAQDVVKATMAGAHVAQMVWALLRHGPERIGLVLRDLREWLEQHEWESLAQMRGNMNLLKVPDAQVYERANYMLMLQSWR